MSAGTEHCSGCGNEGYDYAVIQVLTDDYSYKTIVLCPSCYVTVFKYMTSRS